jgi:hypothetical protein
MESTQHGSETRAAARGWLDRGDAALRPTSAREALRLLDLVTERLLSEGDPRAAFPDIYAIITRRVAENVEASQALREAPLASQPLRGATLASVRTTDGADAFFQEPRWISRLAGRFCERYLETLRWSLDGAPQDAGAWDTTYTSCSVPGTLPLQHVMLGLSAHINYDLAIGIHRTIIEFGATDAATLRRYKHDHDAVNDLLRASIPEAFDHLVARHHCVAASAIFHRGYAFAEWATMRVLTSWRARVWEDALDMLGARTAAMRDVIVRRMERVSRRYARLLALPGLIPVQPAPAGSTSRRVLSALT